MSLFKKVYSFLHQNKIDIISELQLNRILQGKHLAEINNKKETIQQLEEVEFKVFSQWGDDGIIQYLIHHIDIPNKTFVEFGVENYTEANTRFLLINNNWSGLIMDGSSENIEYVKKDTISWKYDLQCNAAFITAENVNSLIAASGFHKDVGILHIDIDGNDYWVWKEISVINPIIVIVEFNSVFGYENTWTVPYKAEFNRTNYHYSNLVWGASILSFCDLADEKGYYFIGCNSAGNNAYFVRKDKIGNLPVHTAESGFKLSHFKESRDEKGQLSFKRLHERFETIKGSTVYNTRKNCLEEIQ